MTWFGYIVVGLFTLNAVTIIADDKKKGGARVIGAVLGAALIAGTVLVGTGSV